MKDITQGYKENIFVPHYFPKLAKLVIFIKKPRSCGATVRHGEMRELYSEEPCRHDARVKKASFPKEPPALFSS
jgi:hypothetical protein